MCGVFRQHASEVLPIIVDGLEWFVDEGEQGIWPEVDASEHAALLEVINGSRCGNHNFTRMAHLCPSWAHNIGMPLGASLLTDHPLHDQQMTRAQEANGKAAASARPARQD